MKPQTRYQILLKSSTGKEKTYELMVGNPPSPNTIIDAINQQLKDVARRSPTSVDVTKYERIIIHWDNHEINLTNPANNGQDTKAFYSPYTKDYEWTKKFLADYYKTGQSEDPSQGERGQKTQPVEGDGSIIDELGPSGGLTPMPDADAGDFFANRNIKADWQTRWNNMEKTSRKIALEDSHRDIRRKEAAARADAEYKDAMESVKTIIDVPQAILRVVLKQADMFLWTLEMIPEEIQAAIKRFSNNIDFIGLSIERFWTIANGIFDYQMKIYKILAMLDWEGATRLLNRLIREQEKTLKYGIENKVITEDGLVAGPENWQIPASAPNSAEEFRFWQAISVLANSPFVGAEVQAQLRFWLLTQYQQRTGVGIPDDYAWVKYVLNDQIGTAQPIQDATDMSGSIPDWFLGKTKQIARITPEIHKVEHQEIKELKH